MSGVERVTEVDVARATSWKVPVRLFATAAGAVAVWFTIVSLLIEPNEVMPRSVIGYSGDLVLGGRARWDAHWFHLIATDGYAAVNARGVPDSPAFLPGYPVLMRLLGFIVRDPMLAGVLISLAAGAVGSYVFYRWTEQRRGPAAARLSLLVLLVYPYSFYLYGVVYSDALFFACAVGAFLLVDRDRPVLAGLVAALACSTRLVGLAVLAGLVLRTIENRGVLTGWARAEWLDRWSRPSAPRGSEADPGRSGLARLRPRDSGVLIGLVGVLAYPAYLWVTFGDPLLFQRAGKTWGQGDGWRTLLKVRTLNDMIIGGTAHDRLALVLQLVLFAGALALVGVVRRRFGWAYAAYVVLLLGITLVTVGNMFGAGRYVLAAFPSFAALAAVLETRPQLARRLGLAGASLMAVFIALFVRGQWVS